MARIGEGAERQAARGAVLALVQALRLLHQHPDNPGLWRTAARRSREAIALATRHGPWTLGIGDGELLAGDEPVLAFAPTEVPFGPLRSAGIGALEFAEGIASESVAQLLERLRGIDDDPDPERAIAALHRGGALPGVQVRAATTFGQDRGSGRYDWSTLPAPTFVEPALLAMVARDLASNLPASVARAALEELSPDTGPAGDALLPLLDAMLQRGDVATVTWLLGEIENHPNVHPECRLRLQAHASAHCDDAWLRDRLARGSRDEVLALVGLVLQLGAAATARCTAVLQTSQHPYAQVLLPLLPTLS